MPSGQDHKGGRRKDRTGATQPEQVPETAPRSEHTWPGGDEVSAASLREGLRPLTAARSHEESIAELILSGEILRAFETDPCTASNVIAEHARSGDPRWTAIAPTLPSTLASLIEEQAQAEKDAEEEAREHQALVLIHLAEALASITQDTSEQSYAFELVLSETAALRHDARAAVLNSVKSSFEPRDLIPNILRFVQRASGHGRDVFEDFLRALADTIDPGFAVYSESPTDAESCRTTVLPHFGRLLDDDRLDEWVKDKVARIVWTRAKTLGSGLHAIIEKMAKATKAVHRLRDQPGGKLSPSYEIVEVAGEQIAWRIYRDVVLASPESDQAQLEEAAEWVIEHSSAVEEDRSAWRLYVNILRYSREPERRIAAAGRLPTSMRGQLPDDVKEVLNFLDHVFTQSEFPDLRKAAKAALELIGAGDAKAAAGQNITIICASNLESPAALSGGCTVVFVGSHGLLIHPNLTLLASPGETFRVPCKESSQDASLGATAAPPPDLDLSSLQVATNWVEDAFASAAAAAPGVLAEGSDLASISFTTGDPVVLSVRTLMVSEPNGNERLDAAGTRRRSHRGSDRSSQRGMSGELGKPPGTEDVWALIHDIDAELAPTRATILPKLESLLTMLAEIGTLGTFEANDKAVKKLDEYLGICKQQLTYTDAQRNLRDVPVTVDCLDLADYRAGAIRIYRGNHGKAVTQKSRFPSFGLMPIEESAAE